MPKKKQPEDKRAVILRTESTPIKDLNVFHKNPRVGNVKEIAKSLHLNGMFRPLVVNVGTYTGRPMEILAGNHTYLAARQEVLWQSGGITYDKQPWTDVMASYVDVDDDTARRIVLVDNKSSDDGTYDESVLADLMQELPSIDGTGYSQEEFADITSVFDDLEAHTGADYLDAVEETLAAEDAGGRPRKFDDAPLGDEIEDDIEDDRISVREAERRKDAGVNLDQVSSDLPGAKQLIDDPYFDYVQTVGGMDIPRLLNGKKNLMQPEDVPDKLSTWAGSATRNLPVNDDPDHYWMYNYGVDSTSGMKHVENCIVSFFCADDQTEILTRHGWVTHDDLSDDDEVLTFNQSLNVSEWNKVKGVHRFDFDGSLNRMTNRYMDALVTDDHKWPVWNKNRKQFELVKTHALRQQHRLVLGRANTDINAQILSDDLVALVGWFVTEGHWESNGRRCRITQSQTVNPDHCKSIRTCLDGVGAVYSVQPVGPDCIRFDIGIGATTLLKVHAPDKVLSADFIQQLTSEQRRMLIEVLVSADGYHTTDNGYDIKEFTSSSVEQLDAFQMLCSLEGIVFRYRLLESRNPWTKKPHYGGTLCKGQDTWFQNISVEKESYTGIVWCPRTQNKTWLARRNGKVYFTGNTWDDYFENWWNTPSKFVSKLLNSKIEFITTPDFTPTDEMGNTFLMWQLYRTRFLGRYFQDAGLKLLPHINWPDGNIKFLEENVLATLPDDIPVLLLQAQTIDPKAVDMKLYIKSNQMVLDHVKPEKLVLYAGKPGKQIFENDLDLHGAELVFLEHRQTALSEQAKTRTKKTGL